MRLPSASRVGHVLARRGRWGWATLAVAVAAGALFITTGLSSHGLDLRAASVTDLASVVSQEKQRTDGLQAQVAAVNREVARLTRRVDDPNVSRLQRQVNALKGPVGLLPESGPGVVVTLDDAPAEEIDKVAAQGGPVTMDMLVVHQQDIQAVANALWRGGAEAMTINGQRIIATTGIKCVGNTVILHGVPYSPPYRLAAIGNQVGMEASLAHDPYVQAYQTFVDRFRLGYDLRPESELRLPGYQGSIELRHARPLATD
ncbi:MAG TPA: DUF881 domain-containing protein [Marmoricola sp.]|nr:DUF881 domain-containing protein [Marmoricola sp.]